MSEKSGSKAACCHIAALFGNWLIDTTPVGEMNEGVGGVCEAAGVVSVVGRVVQLWIRVVDASARAA